MKCSSTPVRPGKETSGLGGDSRCSLDGNTRAPPREEEMRTTPSAAWMAILVRRRERRRCGQPRRRRPALEERVGAAWMAILVRTESKSKEWETDRGFAVPTQHNDILHSRLAVAWTANKSFPEMISHQPWQGTCSALWWELKIQQSILLEHISIFYLIKFGKVWQIWYFRT